MFTTAVLGYVALTTEAHTRAEIAAITGLPVTEVDTALEALARRGLVEPVEAWEVTTAAPEDPKTARPPATDLQADTLRVMRAAVWPRSLDDLARRSNRTRASMLIVTRGFERRRPPWAQPVQAWQRTTITALSADTVTSNRTQRGVQCE
ncbi:helix-turn-helix domain-containing protein [Nocardia terpenica]|uniref:HTH iclR-type domain-containing protein n=1 Tax=Nocardia terpenica TaxID=455432 RepID=A0A164JUV2_9NOCA|nr:helix-turn-helix domain-containing protein [Nocardia terpenica]KZM70743.1 hypothetical protein AWN90_39990 [Nocardia terpenica]NQE89991.1 helix-turn-helix domain-containing protein [Nocardia terpenica]